MTEWGDKAWIRLKQKLFRSAPMWQSRASEDLIQSRFCQLSRGVGASSKWSPWASLSLSAKLASGYQWWKSLSFLAFLCGGGEHWVFKVCQLCQGAVLSDRPGWKGRLWLYTVATDHFQVWKQEVWFNRNFSAWLQRGYDEPFKAESFLSKIKSMAVISYKFFSSGVLFFFFYPEKLNLEVVSVYQRWLLTSMCVCTCVCIST